MKTKLLWARALIIDASDRSYSETVLPLLDAAEKEIVISLYLIEPDDSAGPNHPVNRFMESLLRARGRGVPVRIFLNSNFRFRPKTEVGQGNYFDRLLKAGVELATLLPNRRLHDKLIVIDGRYVIEGSTNWSAAALESNYECSCVIDSPIHAKNMLERIERLLLPPVSYPAHHPVDEIDQPLFSLPETVQIPIVLFENNFLSRMVNESDDRVMDLYLILLGQSRAAATNGFNLDLETLGRALGLPLDWARARVRRQVIKVLHKLAKRYELIDVEIAYSGDAKVRLKELPGGQFTIPGYLLNADYLTQESTGVVFLALAAQLLKKEGVEIDTLSAPQLEKRFGIDASTFVRARSLNGTGS